MVAYKALVSGDVTAISQQADSDMTAAKGLASGSYTFWGRATAPALVWQPLPAPPPTSQLASGSAIGMATARVCS